MGQKATSRSRTPGSRETGHSKGETSTGLESDDMPKSCWIKEEIQRVVREELKPVKSDLKEAKKDLKFLISYFTDIFASHIRDIVKGKKVQPICSSVKDDDTIQGEVGEEFEHSSSHFVQPVRSSGKRRKKDEVRNWQLQLKKGLPSSVYTEQKLTIDVKLVDANTGDIVKLGPQSSVKVEVMVVDSDHENWTHEHLKKPLDPRKGKAPLLSGDLRVNLNGGTGVLHNVCFTDNSSWTRSGKFRLAVRVLPEHHEYIREAILEPIIVKAKRGQANEKHDEPAPDDEVWRLKNIGRVGPFRMNLENAGICTVRQFRQQLDRDPEKLRKILGPAMTKGKWDKLREHAETCRLNGNPHVSLDNESDHQNGRQLTDHTTDRVHRAADKFSLKQENHEDATGKASSSFPYQVSEKTAPARHNMAPSTSAAPVGPEAPPASAGFTAEGLNDGTGLPSTIQCQYTMKAPANEALPPRQSTRVSSFRDLVPLRVNAITTVNKSQDFNSQATMPSHGIRSSSLMGHTLNENAPLFGASMPSFQNDGATASRRPRCTYFGNTTEPPANDSVPLALYPGHDGSTTVGLTNQPHDTNSQPTMPSHVTDSSSPMVRTLNENVPSRGQPHASVSSFQDGHDGLAPLASHQPTFANNCNSLISSGGLPARSHGINLQDAMSSRMVNQHVLPSGPTYGSISNFQYGGTLPVRGGNDVIDGVETDLSDGDIQDMIADMYDPNIKLMD